MVKVGVGGTAIALCFPAIFATRCQAQQSRKLASAQKLSVSKDNGIAMKFMVCVSHDGLGEFSADDLTLGRLYELTCPEDMHGMVRVIDDSGEDYLYPASLFDAIEVNEPTATRLHSLLAA